jgi:hypothetical protein
MVTAVATTSEIHVYRDTPSTQSLDLETGGTFNAENLETAYDKITKLTIENQDALNRVIRAPQTDSTSLDMELPSSIDRADKYLTFDSDGEPTATTEKTAGTVSFSTFGETLVDDANAAAAQTTLKLKDGSASLEVAGLITKSPVFDVTHSDYGATGDGTTDDTLAIQAAIDAAEGAGGGTVFFPEGKYLITHNNTLIDIYAGTHFAAIAIEADNIDLVGVGSGSILYIADWQLFSTANLQAYITIGSKNGDVNNCHIRDLAVLGILDENSAINAATSWMFDLGSVGSTVTTSNSGFRNIVAQNCGNVFGFTGGDNDPTNDAQCENNYITNCKITNCARQPIGCHSGGQANTIVSHNSIVACRGLGIEWAGMRANISDNIIVDAEQGGISFEQVSTHTGWSIVANNTILRPGAFNTGTSGAGISLGQVNGAHRVAVIGNTIQKAYGQGIYSIPASNDLVVENNYIDEFCIDGDSRTLGYAGAGWTGIYIVGNDRAWIRNNVIRAGASAGDRCEVALRTGGSAATDNYTDGNISLGTFDDGIPFDYVNSPGSGGAGTRCFAGKNIDGTTGAVYFLGNSSGAPTIPAFTAADATPSVLGSDVWETGGADTYTDLDDGVPGQIVTILSKHAAVFDTTGTNLTGSSVDITTASGDTTQWLCEDGTTWRLLGFVDASADNSGGA